MAISIFPRVDVTGTNRWSPLRRGHWSTQGLLMCLSCGQGVSAVRYPATLIGAYSASATASAGPQGMNFTSETHYLQSMTLNQAPTNRVTVLCVRQCADTTLRAGQLFGSNEGGVLGRLDVTAPYLNGTLYWDFGYSGATPGRLTVSLTKTTEVEAWAFVAGANGQAIYRNGQRLAAHTTACTRDRGNGNFRINGGQVDGDRQEIRFFALLDAEWIPAQIAEWTANPWLMFGTSAIYTDTVAGPTATTYAAAFLEGW